MLALFSMNTHTHTHSRTHVCVCGCATVWVTQLRFRGDCECTFVRANQPRRMKQAVGPQDGAFVLIWQAYKHELHPFTPPRPGPMRPEGNIRVVCQGERMTTAPPTKSLAAFLTRWGGRGWCWCWWWWETGSFHHADTCTLAKKPGMIMTAAMSAWPRPARAWRAARPSSQVVIFCVSSARSLCSQPERLPSAGEAAAFRRLARYPGFNVASSSCSAFSRLTDVQSD